MPFCDKTIKSYTTSTKTDPTGHQTSHQNTIKDRASRYETKAGTIKMDQVRQVSVIKKAWCHSAPADYKSWAGWKIQRGHSSQQNRISREGQENRSKNVSPQKRKKWLQKNLWFNNHRGTYSRKVLWKVHKKLDGDFYFLSVSPGSILIFLCCLGNRGYVASTQKRYKSE